MGQSEGDHACYEAPAIPCLSSYLVDHSDQMPVINDADDYDDAFGDELVLYFSREGMGGIMWTEYSVHRSKCTFDVHFMFI